MYYAVILLNCNGDSSFLFSDGDKPSLNELIFEDIKEAHKTLKKYKGSRMKTFESKDRALEFLENPDIDESFRESFIEEQPSKSEIDIIESLEKLTVNDKNDLAGKSEAETSKLYSKPEPSELSQLKRKIESGNYEEVERIIWDNPRCLVTVSDSATYLMAGPKYNACHIAARSNKPDIIALILDAISNISFIKKLYPDETDSNLQDRINHLLDSYLNTPDPKLGNTPLHFACKKGFYKVAKVLLTFEGCDIKIKDSAGLTAEESVCQQAQADAGDVATVKKIKDLFKVQLHLPLHRDQLKKRLLLAKRRNSGNYDSDDSFSENSFSFSPI